MDVLIINSVAKILSQYIHISNQHVICIITNLFVNYVSVKEKNAFLWAANKKLQWSNSFKLWKKSTSYPELQTQPNYRSNQRANKDIFRQSLKNLTFLEPFSWRLLENTLLKNEVTNYEKGTNKTQETGNPTQKRDEEWQKDQEGDPRWRLWPGPQVKEDWNLKC